MRPGLDHGNAGRHPAGRLRAAAPAMAEWRLAEAGLARALAGAALAHGALEERVRAEGDALRQRLVLAEAAGLSWPLGERIAAERLALYLDTRLGGAAGDAPALRRAAWAARRLGRGRAVAPAGLAAFLGLEATGPDYAIWRRAVTAASGLHPFTRAALAWHAWRQLLPLGPGHLVEGAVAASVTGAAAGRGGLGFVALALEGGAGLGADGAAEARLSAWLGAAERSALAGLMLADRLSAWRYRAAREAGRGRSLGALVALLGTTPLVSPALASAAGCGTASTVGRNLARLAAADLAEEVTGQASFRLWRARL